MKLSSCALIAACVIASANAFSLSGVPQRQRSLCGITSRSSVWTSGKSSTSTTAMQMSDFGSAMPAKPEQTLEEKLSESATTYIATITGQLGEGVDPPDALVKLREARDDGADAKTLAARTYELMIEQGMMYDQDPDTGLLTLTEWDIKENLETPEVKKEFAFLYKYGMNLIAKGLLDVDDAKEIVKKGLIDRTGKTPEDFDKWLGY